MLRVCILGDSHSAALKLAYDDIAADHPDIHVSYFVGTGGAIRFVELNDGRISFQREYAAEKARELCGHDTITVADYDVFICPGMMSKLNRILYGLKQHRLIGTGDPSPHLASRAVYIDVCLENYRQSSLSTVLSLLAEAGGPPTFVLLKPLVGANVLDRPKSDGVSSVYAELRQNPDYRNQVIGVFEEALQRVLPDFAKYFPQPPETTLDGVLTDARYSVGSERWDDVKGAHEDEDFKHMNKDYGHAMWSVLLPHLKAMQQKD